MKEGDTPPAAGDVTGEQSRLTPADGEIDPGYTNGDMDPSDSSSEIGEEPVPSPKFASTEGSSKVVSVVNMGEEVHTEGDAEHPSSSDEDNGDGSDQEHDREEPVPSTTAKYASTEGSSKAVSVESLGEEVHTEGDAENPSSSDEDDVSDDDDGDGSDQEHDRAATVNVANFPAETGDYIDDDSSEESDDEGSALDIDGEDRESDDGDGRQREQPRAVLHGVVDDSTTSASPRLASSSEADDIAQECAGSDDDADWTGERTNVHTLDRADVVHMLRTAAMERDVVALRRAVQEVESAGLESESAAGRRLLARLEAQGSLGPARSQSSVFDSDSGAHSVARGGDVYAKARREVEKHREEVAEFEYENRRQRNIERKSNEPETQWEQQQREQQQRELEQQRQLRQQRQRLEQQQWEQLERKPQRPPSQEIWDEQEQSGWEDERQEASVVDEQVVETQAEKLTPGTESHKEELQRTPVPAPTPVHENDNICTICLSSMDSAGTTCTLPCKHTFHVACIEVWLENKQGAHCPLCRITIGTIHGTAMYEHDPASASVDAVVHERTARRTSDASELKQAKPQKSRGKLTDEAQNTAATIHTKPSATWPPGGIRWVNFGDTTTKPSKRIDRETALALVASGTLSDDPLCMCFHRGVTEWMPFATERVALGL